MHGLHEFGDVLVEIPVSKIIFKNTVTIFKVKILNFNFLQAIEELFLPWQSHTIVIQTFLLLVIMLCRLSKEPVDGIDYINKAPGADVGDEPLLFFMELVMHFI